MSPKVDWYYDRASDVVVVVTTTMTYTLLYVSHINNVVKVPPVPTPVDLPEFLWLPPASPKYELILEPEPLLEYIPLLEL